MLRVDASLTTAAAMIGQKLSHYTLEMLLGSGGMGEVYRAHDPRLDRHVAVKLIAEKASRDPEITRRFVTEAKAASALNHPNIVTVHEIGSEGGVPFIVMELVDGAPLSTVTGAPVPLERFLDIAIQITSALAAAHAAGIVHRDIKAANVMIRPSGQVKVVDFGLARLAPRPSGPGDTGLETKTWEAPATRAGTVLGTVGCMSPEQVEGRAADARSDVFSLGVLLYQLLTGRAPFEGDTPISIVTAILRDEPSPVDAIRDDVPAALSTLVARCLVKRPEGRPETAGEVHRELLEIRDSVAGSTASRVRYPVAMAAVVGVAILLAALSVFWWQRDSAQRWVRAEALPEIRRLADQDDLHAAYRLLLRALEVSPDDAQLQQQLFDLTMPVSFTSEPPGAEIALREYRPPDGDWIPLGTTPVEAVRIPFAASRVRVTLDGFVPVEAAPEMRDLSAGFRLHRPDEAPAGMVLVPAGPARFEGTSVTVPEFWIGKHEVTNREFEELVEADGYRRPELWRYPFVEDGRTLTWEEAMEELVDSTGLPGPATWELGSYPVGEGEHPVEGVSWYEAAAFAEFAGKNLPTVYHWNRAAALPNFFADILPASNFSGRGAVAAGASGGLGAHGTYDMAGNVKEWCFNSSGEKRYLLGGSWLDPSYTFAEPNAQPPFERRLGFGFRLVEGAEPLAAEILQDLPRQERAVRAPVDDATFANYARLFDYDPTPLDAVIEEVDDSQEAWRREIVSFAAGYPGERVPAHVFLPSGREPPFQTVVVFPGADAVLASSSRAMHFRWFEPYLRSGRAVVHPIYRGTYERGVPGPLGPHAERDLRIQQVKDVRRPLDYIETRPDLDADRLVYYGLSMGASRAPLVLAVEPRFEAAVIMAGGVAGNFPPEVQTENFLPRVTLPVLFVSSRHDFVFPYETSQLPYFELLGTPADRKRHVVMEGGHLPEPFNEVIREILTWIDRWLGPV